LNNLSYRQGILTININNIKTGELVYIISEEEQDYVIRRCYASPVEKVNKKYIKTI
jgi:hypothetical protein